jgi:hypothetical protein
MRSKRRVIAAVAGVSLTLSVAAWRGTSSAQSQMLTLDDFESGIRVVQPLATDKTRLLWMLYADNGTPGVSVTSLSTSQHHDGSNSLQSHFTQSLAGSPSGSTYLSNWQFYFYPYIDPAGTLGMSPNGWHYAHEFAPSGYALGTVNRL